MACAELLAPLGVGDRFVEAALGAAQGAGADVEAAAVEAHHRDAEAFAFAADAVAGGNADLVEIDLGGRLRMPAQFLLIGAEADALHVLFDHQAADALGAVLAGADHGDIDFILAAARDERLGARDDIIVAVLDRLGLERRGVGARRRLGQAIAGHPLHRDQVGKVFRLQFGRAEAVDHPARHIVDRDERAGRRAAIGHRLHDQRGFEPAEPDAARFLGDVDRAEAQLRRLADRVAREDMLFVPLGGERRDRVGGEFLRHLLDLALVVGEVELGHGRGP